MTDQTLTTEEVRQDYMWGVHACGCCAEMEEADAEAFDRWRAQERAKAQVEALREAAEAFDAATINVEIFGDSEEARLWQDRSAQRKRFVSSLRDRADRIAREAGIETGESDE